MLQEQVVVAYWRDIRSNKNSDCIWKCAGHNRSRTTLEFSLDLACENVLIRVCQLGGIEANDDREKPTVGLEPTVWYSGLQNRCNRPLCDVGVPNIFLALIAEP
jgi:hypothetical protein